MVETTTIISIMVAIIVSFFFGMGFVSFLLKGFFGAFLKVRMHRQRRAVVKVFSQMETYYRVGRILDGASGKTELVFTDLDKEQRRYILPRRGLYRSLGVYWVDVNGEKNSIYTHEEQPEVSGFDPITYDSLISRALQKPAILNTRTNLILILLCVVIFAVLGMLFFQFKTYQVLGLLSQQITDFNAIKGVV